MTRIVVEYTRQQQQQQQMTMDCCGCAVGATGWQGRKQSGRTTNLVMAKKYCNFEDQTSRPSSGRFH